MEQIEFRKLVLAALNNFEKQCILARTNEKCFYHSEHSSGVTCIVGHMMDSDETRKCAETFSPETSGIKGLYEFGFPWATKFTLPQIMFLGTLQSIHDDSSFNFNEVVQQLKKEIQDYFSETYDIIVMGE